MASAFTVKEMVHTLTLKLSSREVEYLIQALSGQKKLHDLLSDLIAIKQGERIGEQRRD